MTPEDCARIHQAAFAGQGRGWSAQEFTDLLASPHSCLVATDHAFALGRIIADEAELLTIATDPAHRRQGLARRCLRDLHAAATHRGAAQIFLEVATDNPAAIALYQGLGYVETARRHGYYAKPDGTVDALIMTCPLT